MTALLPCGERGIHWGYEESPSLLQFVGHFWAWGILHTCCECWALKRIKVPKSVIQDHIICTHFDYFDFHVLICWVFLLFFVFHSLFLGLIKVPSPLAIMPCLFARLPLLNSHWAGLCLEWGEMLAWPGCQATNKINVPCRSFHCGSRSWKGVHLIFKSWILL